MKLCGDYMRQSSHAVMGAWLKHPSISDIASPSEGKKYIMQYFLPDVKLRLICRVSRHMTDQQAPL